MEKDIYGKPSTSHGIGHCEKKNVSIRRTAGDDHAEHAHHVKDTVWIESRIDDHRCVGDHVENVAAIIEFHGRAGERQETSGWVCDVLVHVTRIITLFRDRVYLLEKCLTVHGSVSEDRLGGKQNEPT
jgi:hypothetical protein